MSKTDAHQSHFTHLGTPRESYEHIQGVCIHTIAPWQILVSLLEQACNQITKVSLGNSLYQNQVTETSDLYQSS